MKESSFKHYRFKEIEPDTDMLKILCGANPTLDMIEFENEEQTREKQMAYIAKQIYKLAKEINPETTFLNIAINERGEDGTPYNTVHIYNNYWESKVNTIEIWEELK